MGRANKSLSIIAPPDQKYACRDCPARCCSSPWGIPVSEEERTRILADADAAGRLNERARAVLRAGILPMQELDGRLACVFLDQDQLCSLQKKHGHAFIPAPCQAYPFGFSENERGQPVALLSRYCPSIRDSYGEPASQILGAKLEQAGGMKPLAEKMGLRSGRVLARKHFARLAEGFRAILAGSDSAAQALLQIYESLDAFDEALPRKVPDDAAVDAAWSTALAQHAPPAVPSPPGFNHRVFLAYTLGGLSYPTRVLMPHRTTAISLLERLRALGNRIRWFLGRGRVDLYLVSGSVPVAQIRRVASPLVGPLSHLVSAYLSEVLLRRQGMSRQTYLSRVVVDLALMALLISQHARAAAAAAGRSEPSEAEVREGIGIAELLFSHQSDGAQSAVFDSLRLKLMADPTDFRRLITGELSGGSSSKSAASPR